ERRRACLDDCLSVARGQRGAGKDDGDPEERKRPDQLHELRPPWKCCRPPHQVVRGGAKRRIPAFRRRSGEARVRRRRRPAHPYLGQRFFSIRVSVFCPLANAQWICAVSPCLNFAFTSADLSAGIAQVKPATVMEVAESAEMAPRASLFSARTFAG